MLTVEQTALKGIQLIRDNVVLEHENQIINEIRRIFDEMLADKNSTLKKLEQALCRFVEPLGKRSAAMQIRFSILNEMEIMIRKMKLNY